MWKVWNRRWNSKIWEFESIENLLATESLKFIVRKDK